ncbi:substrate-binding domain-containing protein [Caulobacter sp. CCNWLY153]|uniref:substrate-binding domain-containing protein n=1 Tax=unclassified Caulobacter TaxID=2648921 RepID=UPI002FF3BD48
MSKLKLRVIAGVSAIAACAAFAATANAATVYGGGSSLIAPYWRQAADCYGTDEVLLVKASPVSTLPVTAFCAPGANSGNTVQYISTGSGTGIASIYSHDAAKYGDIDGATGGDQFWPKVNYALSETSLTANDINTYNNGGTIQGVTVAASPTAGQYPLPKSLYGAAVQFPVAIAPVAVAFDPVYKKTRNVDGTITSTSFNLTGGQLNLDADAYCKIFNGQITDWNDSALTALNGGVSLTGGVSVPMQIVGRSESSGTTGLFTRHLAAVCGSLAGNAFADGASTLPAGLQGGTYNKSTGVVTGEVSGKFTRAEGSDGVSKYLAFTADPAATAGSTVVQARVGYVGSDYTLPYSINTGNNYGLASAALKNAAGSFVKPSPLAATTAFGSLLPPQSNSAGGYSAGTTANGLRANPQDWVQSSSKTSPLANPSVSGSYPIIGTVNWIGYTCYADSASLGVITTSANGGVLNLLDTSLITDPSSGLLANAGLAALPTAWSTAIKNTFLNPPNATVRGLNLYLDVAGTTTGNATCGVAGIVGA